MNNGTERKRINVADVITQQPTKTYRDFEGLVDGEEVLQACQIPITNAGGEVYYKPVWEIYLNPYASTTTQHYLRAIVLNLVHEYLEAQDEIEEEVLHAICHTANELLTCSEWTDVTDEDIAQFGKDKHK